MGNHCNSNESQLKKAEPTNLLDLIIVSHISIDFYRKAALTEQYDCKFSKSKTKQLLKLIYDTVSSAQSYQQRFFAMALCDKVLLKPEDSGTVLAKSLLMKDVLKQLKAEVAFVDGYQKGSKVRLWRERYFLLSLEMVWTLARSNHSGTRVYRDFIASHQLNGRVEPFYIQLNHQKIKESQIELGKLNRHQHQNC